MDKQKTGRIIGILVVIALVIIFSHFFLQEKQGGPKPTATVASNTQSNVQLPAGPFPAAMIEPVVSEETPAPNAAANANQPPHQEVVMLVPPQQNYDTPVSAAKPQSEVKLPKAVHQEKRLVQSYPVSRPVKSMPKSVWVVQMGNFKKSANAYRLVKQLKEAGYKAFAFQVKSSAGTRTRVYIGSASNKISAMRLSAQVAHKTKLNGFVTPFL
jgi:DedD protein